MRRPICLEARSESYISSDGIPFYGVKFALAIENMMNSILIIKQRDSIFPSQDWDINQEAISEVEQEEFVWCPFERKQLFIHFIEWAVRNLKDKDEKIGEVILLGNFLL